MELNGLLNDAPWRTSSYSSSNGGDCVELAPLSGAVAVRDSKNPTGGTLLVSGATFRAFTRTLTR